MLGGFGKFSTFSRMQRLKRAVGGIGGCEIVNLSAFLEVAVARVSAPSV